jgi:hypothetical protein
VTRCVACRKNDKCTLNFGQKTTKERPLGRPRHRWKKIIKMDFRDVCCEDMNCIQLPIDRVQYGVL